MDRLSLVLALLATLLYGLAIAFDPGLGEVLFLAGIGLSLAAVVTGILSRTEKAGRAGRNLGLVQLGLVAVLFVWLTPRTKEGAMVSHGGTAESSAPEVPPVH